MLQEIWVARNKYEGYERFVKHRCEGDAGIYCLEEDSGGMGREMEVKLKLTMLKRITNLDEWSDCAGLRQRADRRMMIRLRGGMAAFQIETGRWRGVDTEYAKSVEKAR